MALISICSKNPTVMQLEAKLALDISIPEEIVSNLTVSQVMALQSDAREILRGYADKAIKEVLESHYLKERKVMPKDMAAPIDSTALEVRLWDMGVG